MGVDRRRLGRTAFQAACLLLLAAGVARVVHHYASAGWPDPGAVALIGDDPVSLDEFLYERSLERSARPPREILVEHLSHLLLWNAAAAESFHGRPPMREIVVDVAATGLRRALEAAHAPSESEIVAFYEANRGLFQANVEKEIRVILVRSDAEADEILRLLRLGVRFEKLARERSVHPLRVRDGDLGFLDPMTLAGYPRLAEAIASLGEGETSGSVPTERGAFRQILRCTAVRPRRPTPIEEVRPEIEAWLRAEKGRAAAESLVRNLSAGDAPAVRVELDERAFAAFLASADPDGSAVLARVAPGPGWTDRSAGFSRYAGPAGAGDSDGDRSSPPAAAPLGPVPFEIPASLLQKVLVDFPDKTAADALYELAADRVLTLESIRRGAYRENPTWSILLQALPSEALRQVALAQTVAEPELRARYDAGGFTEPYLAVRDRLEKELLAARQKAAMEKRVAELFAKHRVRLNESLLRNLK